MAEQIIGVVTSEVVRILFSGLVGRLDNSNRQAAAADKKLLRLELLLIKIHSAVEASEKHPIENAWLVKWRDKFKEAAAEGDEVLASFRQPAINSAPAAGDAQQQQEEESHSKSAASAPATTRGASSSGMAHDIRGANSEDIQRLNSAVEKLEELSPEIGDFIKLLKVEILALESKSTEKTEGTMAMTRKRPKQFPDTASPMRMTVSSRRPMMKTEASENKPTETTAMMNQTATQEEEQNTLSFRLKKAYATIRRNVKLANGRDLRGHEWLAHWASILREAKGQGRAVRGAIRARRHRGAIAVDDGAEAACEQAAECDGDREDDEDSELGRFVCGMESLAGEADYFAGLACLCPSY